MGSLPFSAKRPRSLPTYVGTQDLATVLANWQTQLAPGVQNVAPQATPLNFSITNSRGGLTINWSPVTGGDGYEILKSATGSFADDLQVIPVKNVNQSSYFDSMGGNAQSATYRIRTTSGTASNPQSQRGPESGTIRHTSIDASDTKSIPTTIFDTFTTDKTRALARIGNYGAVRKTPLGKAGGSVVGAGAKAGSGLSAGLPAAAATSPASLGSGTISKSAIVVSGGASITPSTVNPGVIDANELQGIPVTLTAPTNGEVLQYSSATGQLAYTSIIAIGLQSALQSVLPLGLGEIYVATDTGNLFIGTPGVGSGYLQVGDTTKMNETLLQLLMEIRSMRVALTSLACQGGTANPLDFDPQMLASDAEIADRAQI
jgi:hypothetical protein